MDSTDRSGNGWGANASKTPHSLGRLTLAFALALSHVVIGAIPADAAAATVNSTGDANDQTPGDGIWYTGNVNVDSANECTLRAAITESNALAGSDTILFNVPIGDPGSEAFPLADRIEPNPGLPNITGTTTIDGTSQRQSFIWTVLNLSPSAGADSYSVTEGTLLTVVAPGVLANDTDPDGDALTAAVVSGASQGVLTVNADGSFTYMHTSGTVDDDSFTYEASDGNGGVAVATVSIQVNRSNVAPVAAADTVVLFEDNIAIFNPAAERH